MLSRDRDFFRYRDSKFPIYFDYKIETYQTKQGHNRQKLVLFKAREPESPSEPRDLQLDPLPKTFDYYPNADIILSHKPHSYMRGCPSSLTKHTGNLHAIIRPLRQAFYALIGIQLEDCAEKRRVLEMFLYWDSETHSCKWTSDIVPPDDKLAPLLTGPSIVGAIDYFIDECLKQRPSHVQQDTLVWQNHLFALVSAIAELRSQVVKGTYIFQMVQEAEKHLEAQGIRLKKEFVPHKETDLVGMMAKVSLEETKE